MRSLKSVSRLALVAVLLVSASASAQEMPADYKAVLSALGKSGDFRDGVLKVNIPRNDLRVTISQRPAPTPFGFGGWVALTKGEGMDVMMGDLVLTEDEVNPVMSALHYYGTGPAAKLAQAVRGAVDLLGKSSSNNR
jgi:hypothetical protein